MSRTMSRYDWTVRAVNYFMGMGWGVFLGWVIWG